MAHSYLLTLRKDFLSCAFFYSLTYRAGYTLTLIVSALILLGNSSAKARRAEAGELRALAEIGIALRSNANLPASETFFPITLHGDYMFTRHIGAYAGGSLGLAGSWHIQSEVGAVFRTALFEGPFQPLAELGFVLGQVRSLKSIGQNNAGLVAIKLALGSDYSFTKAWAAGLLLQFSAGKVRAPFDELWFLTGIALRVTHNFGG